MIRSVIVEDELSARESLKIMLQKYCPDVMVVGEGFDVSSGKDIIEKMHPDLVFLDIEMPDGSAFRMLNYLPNPDFEIIFTTAYDQFAIKAIRYSALDYLLKPINPTELVAAVQKVKVAKQKKNNMLQIDALIHNLADNPVQQKKIVLTTSDKIHVVEVDQIIRCESDNYYTNFYFADGSKLLISKTLKEIESMLEGADFIRTHKSYLVNVRYIQNFLKDENALVLKDGSKIPVSRRKKEQILEVINNL